MSASSRRLAALLAAALAQALAQGPAPPGVTIRTTTTLVQVGVSAQDSHGHAITDLKREEFELLDNGKPQSIAVFYNQTTEGATAAAATPTPPQEPAGRFTNRIPGNAAARGGYSVILLDWANTGFRNTARAREQARAVMNRLGPAERIGLYSLDRTGLKVVNEIGSSREAILKSLKTLTGMPAPCYQEQLDGADATSLNSTDDSMKYVGGGQYMCGGPGYLSGEIKQFYEAQRIRNTLEAFEGIAVHLAGFPGRKALIWVSSAFPLVIPLRDPGTAAFGFHIGGYQYLTEDVDQAVRKLNDAEVAVYPVDARGVSSVALVGGGGDPDAAEIVGTDRFTWPTMDEVAKRTGGIAFYGRNNLDAGIQAAIDDAVAGYTLGFYAPQDRTQAGFHKLTVRSLRPGVTLRYKEGYYVDVPENIANGDRPEAVGVALTAITDATAIPIDVQAWRQENTLTLRVFLRPDTLALQRNGDRWQGAVDFIARFAKEDGSECATPASWRVEFNLTQQSYDAGMQGGPLLSRTLEIPADAARLRVLVRNNPSGEIGTLTIPMATVPLAAPAGAPVSTPPAPSSAPDSMSPSEAEQARFLAVARQVALEHAKSLPDFLCTETVRRSVFAGPQIPYPKVTIFGQGQLGAAATVGGPQERIEDTLTVEVGYYEQQERYRLTETNGSLVKGDYSNAGGFLSRGEFGSNLRRIFDPASAAEFHFERWTTVRRRRVAVYSYRIERSKAHYSIRTSVTGGGQQAEVGLRGEAVIDRETYGVLRLNYMADGIPADFPVRRASATVDYGDAKIGGKPYLLPLKAVVEAEELGVTSRNEVTFHSYRKFSSESTLRFGGEDKP
jgi:VWFA-related protein